MSQCGKNAKSQSMLNDEGTLIAVQEYIEEAGESRYSNKFNPIPEICKGINIRKVC